MLPRTQTPLFPLASFPSTTTTTTTNMTIHHHSTQFPTRFLQFLSSFISFIGVTILTFFISRRLAAEKLTTREGWRRMPWSRLCMLLILFDSYLFVLSAGLLIFGIGLQMDHDSCETGIFICVLFYTTSKILIYCFLTEKVYIVWGNGNRRLRSPVYLACMGVVGLYVGVIIAMILERIAEFRAGDNACVIGLKPTASLPLLAYDLFINVTLTCLFIWPIFRLRGSRSATLRRVALRTFIASLAALTTSTVNIAVLTALHGREFGWICLESCGADVILNAAALFWVTTAPPVPSSPPPELAIESQQPQQSQTRPSQFVSKDPGMVERSGSQLKSKLKPLQLLTGAREKATTGSLRSAPSEFQIHVSTTSMTETSPRSRTGMLPPVDVLPPLSPVDNAKRESGVSTTTIDVSEVEEGKRVSNADSDKTVL
ncbi:hypothetical protein FB45DRAFT_923763 [Roridomyces roridus]|uniref:Transmembrane protein n=1 Tax=Roridomyces roridus TaxID=1738132 RepID=A0AAD7FHH4_9AGAR|nr:hypothetical protein FB45DRAFT_923763 [Roridomyces roridus]